MKNIIAVIAARGGSKGIPNKNLIPFCGKPLIYWSIKVALETPEINSVWVTTDDTLIAEQSQRFGAEVVMRPDELSGDIIMSDAAWEHAINEVSRTSDATIDMVVALQNTSPLRQSSDLSQAILKFKQSECDTMFSGSDASDLTLWSKKETGELESLNFNWRKRLRRQDMKPQFIENGSFYIFTPETIAQSHDRFFGKIEMFAMEKWKSFEIDEIVDIQLCEYLMQNYLLSDI